MFESCRRVRRSGGRRWAQSAILVLVNAPAYVTLFVFRVTRGAVSAHECWGDCDEYVGEVVVPRPRLPRARAGDRIRLRIAETRGLAG